VELDRSRISRAYNGLSGERRAGRADVVTCLVQIIDKPHQVITLEVWHTFPIFLPTKHVVEFIMKPG